MVASPMLTEALLVKLVRAFGLRFQRAVKLRTVYGVQTDGGAMILKRYEGDGMKRRLEALCDALDAVVRAGVDVAPYLRTRDGTPFLAERGALWTMQPWLPGRHLSLCVQEERRAATQALARLHQVPAGRRIERAFFLRVPPLWEKYRYRLERAESATLYELAMRDSWRPFAERAKEAVAQLQQGSYVLALDRDRCHGTLCHRDPAPHNLIYHDGSAGIIDFDLAGSDARAHDLYQVMSHALYLNGWEPGLFEEMIHAYEQVYPLDRDNRRVLDALLLFPSLVVREWYDYGKSRNRETLKTRLSWAMRQEEKRLKETVKR